MLLSYGVLTPRLPALPAALRSYAMASLNHSGAILTNTSRACMAQKRRRWDTLRANGDKRALKETESASLWECFWNSDMRVEWAQLHSAIERAVRDASGTAVPKRGRRREG